jgi:hypothetical protein
MLHAFRDDERRRITVTASGVVSFLDLAAFIDEHLAGGAWGYSVLHDARATITDVTTQTSDIVRHIQAIGGGLRRGPVAVVATDDRYLTTARNYADLANKTGGRMAVFSDLADASEWLDQQIADPV